MQSHSKYVNGISISTQVGKEDVDSTKVPAAMSKPGAGTPVNQYSLVIGLDFGPHDTKSLMKSVESLSFIVRDAAHVTPENFELCVKTIRVFVEASLNGGVCKCYKDFLDYQNLIVFTSFFFFQCKRVTSK